MSPWTNRLPEFPPRRGPRAPTASTAPGEEPSSPALAGRRPLPEWVRERFLDWRADADREMEDECSC